MSFFLMNFELKLLSPPPLKFPLRAPSAAPPPLRYTVAPTIHINTVYCTPQAVGGSTASGLNDIYTNIEIRIIYVSVTLYYITLYIYYKTLFGNCPNYEYSVFNYFFLSVLFRGEQRLCARPPPSRHAMIYLSIII